TQDPEQVAARVGYLLAGRVAPPVAGVPVAADLLPEAGRGGGERRVRLDVVEVLVAADGAERVAREPLLEERPHGRDRERVAVEDEEDVVRAGLGRDRLGQRVQL